MRSVSLASLSVLLAVVAAALVLRVSEQVAVAMILVPLLASIAIGLLLFTREGGWRRSHGLGEWLLFGPVQAEPDKLASRVARIPAVLLCLSASVAVGAIAGMIFGGVA
ncbi:MAG TPA: hypothetical protein VJM31_04725 [Vicinamibacterales bacterium]|nr:hypothetical protein [Vicinamibacterales bacterium]